MSAKYQYCLEPAYAGGRNNWHRWFGKSCRVYSRALDALDTLFEEFLSGGKTAVILTTSQSRYVSSCVTDTAQRHGKWSRTFEDDAGIVVVIHEWGFVHPRMSAVRKICRMRGIPLVEDCARAFGSYFCGGCGQHGDYTLMSLGKFAGLKKDVLVFRTRPPKNAGLSLSGGDLSAPPPAAIIRKRRRVFEWHRIRWKTHKLQWRPRSNEVAEAFLLPCNYDGNFLKNLYARERRGRRMLVWQPPFIFAVPPRPITPRC